MTDVDLINYYNELNQTLDYSDYYNYFDENLVQSSYIVERNLYTANIISCDFFSVKASFSFLHNITELHDSNSTLSPVVDVSVSGVWTACCLDSGIFIGLIITYEILRRAMPSVYEGRNRHVAPERMLPALPLTLNPWGWIYRVIKIPWWRVRESAGMDAYMFLRFIGMCQRITMVCGFWGILVLWPVFGCGDAGATGWYKFSMANIEQSNWRIWIPTVFMWLFSCFVYHVMNKEFHHYIELRMEFLGKGDPDIHPQHHYSLIIERIPRELRSDDALYDYFNSLFPNKIHSACVALNLPELETLNARRLRVTRRLEKSIAYFYSTGRRPTHVVGRGRCLFCGIESAPLSCCNYGKLYDMSSNPEPPQKGEWVDSIDYYTYELLDMNTEVIKMQKDKTTVAKEGNSNAKNWFIRVVDMTTSAATGLLGLEPDEGNTNSATNNPFWNFDCAHPKSLQNATLSYDEIENQRSAPGDSSTAAQSQQYGSFTKLPPGTIYDEAHKVNKGSDSTEDDASSSSSNDSIKNKSQSRAFLSSFQGKTHNLFDRRSDLNRRTSILFPDDANGHTTNTIKSRAKIYSCWNTIKEIIGYDFFIAACSVANNTIDVYVDHVVGTTMSSTGFVTFVDLCTVTYANSSLLTHKPNVLSVTLAPEPRDIVWKNLHIDADLQKGKERFTQAFVILGALLWSIPLTFIQAVANVDALSKVPGLGWLATGDGTLTSFINGYLPVVALLTLIMVLPLIFEWVATNYENRKTKSDIQTSILSRYFYYQLANIYVTVTAGSIWTSLADIIDDPSTIASILGQSLPTVVGYFISLIVTKTLAGLPMVLLRIGELMRFSLLRVLFRERRLTQRELDQIYRSREVLYGWEYPTQLLVIIICFTYACISPVILPFGFVYFSFALLIYKKQVLYVYTPAYESGGTMFPTACSYALMGLCISQCTFLGYAILREGYYQPIALIPLPFVTLQVMKYNKKTFINPSKLLGLERATELDRRNMELTQSVISSPETPRGKDGNVIKTSAISQTFSADAYRQPVLTEPAMEPQPYRTNQIDEVSESISEMVRNGNVVTGYNASTAASAGRYSRMVDTDVHGKILD